MKRNWKLDKVFDSGIDIVSLIESKKLLISLFRPFLVKVVVDIAVDIGFITVVDFFVDTAVKFVFQIPVQVVFIASLVEVYLYE